MTHHRATAVLVVILASASALLAAPALAQDEAHDDVARRASEHFDRGTEFFNEGRFDAALAEFERAYELAPAHQVLYNLARVHDELGHAVQAAEIYERYLREATGQMSAARREEVTRALERNRGRIASLEVRTNVEGATISVDGVDVATTPLEEPLRLSAGAHTVGARAAGYDSLRRAVQLAGGVRETLELELSPLVDQRGTLRIVSDVPGVEVHIDDRMVGTTPLSSTVPVAAGRHVVVGARPGYRTETETVDVQHGAETEVRLRMELDEEAGDALGQLVVHLPDAPHIVRIDGEPMQLRGAGLRLPAGEHHVELEVAERELWSGEVDVPAGERLDLSPELLWTPDARAERVSAASSLRTAGLGVALTGGLLLVGGGSVFLWNESEIATTDQDVDRWNEEFTANRCEGMGGGAPPCTELEAQRADLADDQSRQNTVRTATAIVAGAGALTAVVGLVIWASAATEEEIDAAARAHGPTLRLRAGPSSLHLAGTF